MSVVTQCPSCGRENPSDALFCNSCGARLEEGRAREERKLVSILFVDLVGFTAQSQRADPEDVREALQLYHRAARQQIEQYGGTLEKFIGDAVMAVFGAPVAHGDDAERAVLAGLRVLESIETLNLEHGLELAARAAVNTGDALVSVEGARAGDALATGDVVNTASRLQSAAPPGKLIVSAETFRATRHGIVYEPSSPVQAKGKDEPVSAWLALGPTAGERPGAAARLVGRARELEFMRSAWKRCVEESRPHLITVVGPPGIGKSRLCREISAVIAADGGRLVRGRCLPYEEQVGYQAFSSLVRSLSGVLDSDPPNVARDKLEQTVHELVPHEEAAETSRYVALLLGLAPEDQVGQMRLLYFAARRFIECVGLGTPTVFLFEDIHWAESSEIALLEYLAQHVRDSRVMLVATARPELLDAHPTWGGGLAAQTMIPLDPLAGEEAATLAGQLVGDGTSVDVARLVEVAGGNPLFLEELVASLVELSGTDALPVTVREAIAARIDALPADARSALLAAAVIGTTFWRGVLESVGEVDDVDEALHVLEMRDLVRHDPSSELAEEAQFTFKHMLIREVAYTTVPRAIRRERHAAVAAYVESSIQGATATLPAILAHHWREAGEPKRAIPHLLTAADAARRGWAKEPVVDLYTRALELADEDDLRRRIRLQRALALMELTDYTRAAEELQELLPELDGEDRLEALIALGQSYVWTERDTDTLETAAEAAALAVEQRDESAVAAALALESQGLAMRGAEGDLDRALELGDRALDDWVPGARPLSLRHHLHLHSDAAYWTGYYERGVELARQTRALARDTQSAESLLRGGGLEALSLAGLGRHEEAIAIWDELLALARELGHNPQVVLNYSSLAYRELNDLDEARRRSEHALELSQNDAFGMPRQFAGSDLIFTQLLEGDIGAAWTKWGERWQDAEHATAWTTWLIAGRLATARAEIALALEPPDAAVEWADRAVQIAQRTRRRKYEARSLETLGRALAKLGRNDEALHALRSAVGIADDLVGAPGRWRARSALGSVAYELGNDDAAAAAYEEARDIIDTFVSTLAPERGAKLGAAPEVSDVLSRTSR